VRPQHFGIEALRQLHLVERADEPVHLQRAIGDEDGAFARRTESETEGRLDHRELGGRRRHVGRAARQNVAQRLHPDVGQRRLRTDPCGATRRPPQEDDARAVDLGFDGQQRRGGTRER